MGTLKLTHHPYKSRLGPTRPANWLSAREMAALPNAPCWTALLLPSEKPSCFSSSSKPGMAGGSARRVASSRLSPGALEFSLSTTSKAARRFPAAVPRPTWAISVLGFAGLGYAGYRQAKTRPATSAAWLHRIAALRSVEALASRSNVSAGGGLNLRSFRRQSGTP